MRLARAVAVAFRPLGHAPQDGEPAAKTLDELRSHAGSQRPIALKRLGSGTGMIFPLYVDVNHVDGDGTVNGGYEGWTNDVRVESGTPADARPHGVGRQITLSYRYDDGSGWGYGGAFYGSAVAGGAWSGDFDVHGAAGAPAGHILPAATAYVADGSPLPPVYGYEVQGEGEGEGGRLARPLPTASRLGDDAAAGLPRPGTSGLRRHIGDAAEPDLRDLQQRLHWSRWGIVPRQPRGPAHHVAQRHHCVRPCAAVGCGRRHGA